MKTLLLSTYSHRVSYQVTLEKQQKNGKRFLNARSFSTIYDTIYRACLYCCTLVWYIRLNTTKKPPWFMSAFSGSFLFSLFLNEGGGQTRSVRIAAIWPSSEFDTRIKRSSKGDLHENFISVLLCQERKIFIKQFNNFLPR